MSEKFILPQPSDFDKTLPLYLLDNGHGGIINGKYQTKGKRSPQWEKGVYYEGVGNRDFVDRIIKIAEEHNARNSTKNQKLQCLRLVPEERDVTLEERCMRANKLYRIFPKTVVISVHSNAGGGVGLEVFTSVGQTESDVVAEIMIDNYKEVLQEKAVIRVDLSDGDSDKEAQFFILRYTSCPAILTENLFMDEKSDYNKLFDEKFRDKLAFAHFLTMIDYQEKILL